MKIKIGNYELTTEHPASHYGAGVLVDKNGKGYGPSDFIPKGKITTKMLFGYDTPSITAGDYIKSKIISSDEIFSKDEIDFVKIYLSQNPNSPTLPSYDILKHYWEENDKNANC